MTTEQLSTLLMAISDRKARLASSLPDARFATEEWEKLNDAEQALVACVKRQSAEAA